jgi:hypothetical protein
MYDKSARPLRKSRIIDSANECRLGATGVNHILASYSESLTAAVSLSSEKIELNVTIYGKIEL